MIAIYNSCKRIFSWCSEWKKNRCQTPWFCAGVFLWFSLR